MPILPVSNKGDTKMATITPLYVRRHGARIFSIDTKKSGGWMFSINNCGTC